MALSFPAFGSAVGLSMFAVSAIAVPARLAPTFTTSVKLALPMPSDALLHDTVPFVPTAGVVQVQPAAAVSDANVVPAGNASLSTASVAAAGPALATVIV